MTLSQYLDRRIGRPPAWRQTYRVLVAPFFADSFSEFWRLWNPVWAYWLGRVFYLPLRRRLPRSQAMLGTFLGSGLVHNGLAVLLTRQLSFFTTVFFLALGVVAVGTEKLGIRFTRLPHLVRATVHLSGLYSVYWLTAAVVAP